MAHAIVERTLNIIGINGTGQRFKLNEGMSAAHRARTEETAVSWKYYIGDQKDPLKQRPNQPDFNTVSNWYQKIINDSVDFLFGGGISFTADDDAAQDVITAAWADDPTTGFSFGQFTQELGQSGANGRNAFIRIFINDDGSQTQKIVDPDAVEIIPFPDDIDSVMEYLILWERGDKLMRQRIFVEDNLLSWVIQLQEFRGGDMTGWVNADEPELWPFPFPPVSHCKNLPLASQIWGQPDVWSTALQDAYNRTAANMAKVDMYKSSPQGFIKNRHGNDPIVSSPDMWIPLGQDEEPFFLELNSDLPLSQHQKESILDDFLATTGTVKLSADNLGVGAASGFALRILLSPAIAKANRKRATYGSLFAQVNHALLVINNIEPVKVTNVWGSIVPENLKEQVEIMNSLVAQGASFQAAAKVVGIDNELAEELSATAVTLPTSISPITALLNGAGA